MSAAWLEQRERGSAGSIALIVWIALKAGRRTARALLYPICVYYYARSAETRRVSRDYLRRVLDSEPRARNVLRHYHAFAATVLDRVFLLAGRTAGIAITVNGAALVDRLVLAGRGCIVLGSHIGSFEVLRALGRDAHHRVSIVMNRGNARKTGDALARLAPELEGSIIDSDGPDATLRIRECLERGDIVGILGDRPLAGGRTTAFPFLGVTANFPAGPLAIAAMLGAPVVLFFGLYRGAAGYEVHFEILTEGVAVERSKRDAVVTEWQARYVSRLEHYVRVAPYNWFNFYDFWETRAR
jgi:predicted LPLAT superfamily acyltransferase